MDANLEAMNKYSNKWKGFESDVTRKLYGKAAKTARYGCHLQDEVLVRLGGTIEGHKTRKHYGKDAQKFIDWMTQ